MIDTAALQRYSLFGALQPGDIDSLRPFLESMDCPAGTVLIREGEPNDRIYFILEGCVAVSRKDVPLLEIGEGETFGEMELLDVMPSAATITALRPCRFAMISNRAIHGIFHLDPRIFAIIMMNLARDLSRRLRRMDENATGGRDVQ